MRVVGFIAGTGAFVAAVRALCGFVPAAWRVRPGWCFGPPTRIGDQPVGVLKKPFAPQPGSVSGSFVMRKIILAALAGTAALAATPAFAQADGQAFSGGHIE